MYGGSITNNINTDGFAIPGVSVINGVFNMYGGTITGNTVLHNQVGAVNVEDTFNMYGGSITGNGLTDVVIQSTGKFYKSDNATSPAVTWSSDKAGVATVSGGVVTGVSAGTAVITATADGKSATCTVTVKAADNSGNNSNNNSNYNGGGNTPGYPASVSPTAPPAGKTDDTIDITKPVTPDKIADAARLTKEGDTLTVDMTKTTLLPKDAVEAIKGKEINVVLDMGNGIKWTINGKDIESVSGDINMAVTVGTADIPVDVINNVTGERYNMVISLAHDGPFGFKAVLTVQMRAEDAGMYANLFYYDPGLGDTVLISCGIINTDGTVDLEFTHASDYVIVIDDHPLDDADSNTDDDDTETLDDDDDDDEDDDDVAPEFIEDDDEDDAAAVTDEIVSAASDDGNPNTGAALTGLTAMMIAGFAVVFARKKK